MTPGCCGNARWILRPVSSTIQLAGCGIRRKPGSILEAVFVCVRLGHGSSRIVDRRSRLMLAIGSSLAGPLIDIVAEQFLGVHIFGSSSTGKSTALYLASSMWGSRNGDQIRQWRATDNGLEGVAAETSDVGLYLDEMGQCDPRVLGEICYTLSNGSGKARASRDGSAREVRR